MEEERTLLMPKELLAQSFELITTVGWVFFLVLILVILKDFWLVRITSNYINSLKWVTLEVSIPKENIRSVKSMEQVFAVVYGGMFSFGLRLSQKYIEGMMENWASFEIVGSTSGIRFYIHVIENNRNLIETAFFSQYPNAEIKEVEDYTKVLPKNLPNKEYDIFGTDIILERDDAYPIKTYFDFEDDSEEEDKNVDPIASIIEAISGLKQNEFVWIQLLVQPTGNEWAEKSKALVEELVGNRSKSKKRGIISGSGEFLQNLTVAPLRNPEWSESPGEQKETFRMYTPGEQEVLKAISRKASKRAFNTILRFIYIDEKEEFTATNVQSIMGAIQQFATVDMNSLRPNRKTFTKKSVVSKIPIDAYRKRLLEKRKKQIYRAYIERAIPHKYLSPFTFSLKTSILNIEELASIYHPPTVVVKAGKLQPVGFKKGEPPVDLPVKE